MKRLIITLLFPLFYLSSCSNNSPVEKIKANNPFYDKAFTYLETEKADSAFLFFNKAKDIFTQQKDSLGIGKCLINMAIISTGNGDYFGGQELSLNAFLYFDKKKKEHHAFILSNFNNLGVASENLKNYTQSLAFYKESLSYVTDSTAALLIKNNIANIYRRKKDYKKSLGIYNYILKQDITDKEFARTLSNYAFAKWQQDNNYHAQSEFLTALNLRVKENDIWGQNASYSHLSDYYIKNNSDSALFYAHKMYKVAQKIKSPDDQLQALQKLIKLSPQKESRQYFEIYQNLSDSLQTARSAAKNQFALIRYETEKNKADFLKAQEENIKKQNSILIRNIGIGVLISFSIASYFWYRRRQKILKQEKEIEVKNTEIKYVKKVHDHVANRIYQVMDEIDNRPQMDKDEVAEKLDVIYHISRDLSYENIDSTYKPGFSKALSEMFSSYQSAGVNIVLKGNEEKIWEGVLETVKTEVFTILQELMTNMRKHSGADVVQLTFQHDKQRMTILYSDNGKGIEYFSPGNGLKNTETRIKSISGIITFDTKANQGLNIKFSFPI